MVTTIDWTDVIALKVMAVLAILALPVALFAGAAVIIVLTLSWVLDLDMKRSDRRKARREMANTLAQMRQRNAARAAFVATLPKTKAGKLFPKGQRDLAAYDKSTGAA